MTTEVRAVTTDDLDGSSGAEAVSSSVDGTAIEIDLGPENEHRLHADPQSFVNAGRRIGQKQKRGRKPLARSDWAEIRAWLQEQGLKVSERGRICTSVIQEYDAFHPRG